eukprot:g8693.t1
MFLEIAPTLDRLRFLQRAFPTSSHSNSSSLPIPLDKVLPMCSPLADVSEPITFSEFLYHFSDITSSYIELRGRSKHDAHLQKCFASLLNRVRHFEWLSSVDSSAPQRYCARIRCQGNEVSIPLTCPPMDRLYRLSNPQWDLMAQRRAGLVDASLSVSSLIKISMIMKKAAAVNQPTAAFASSASQFLYSPQAAGLCRGGLARCLSPFRPRAVCLGRPSLQEKIVRRVST